MGVEGLFYKCERADTLKQNDSLSSSLHFLTEVSLDTSVYVHKVTSKQV